MEGAVPSDVPTARRLMSFRWSSSLLKIPGCDEKGRKKEEEKEAQCVCP